MDTTIRNLDPEAYRRFKARAALEGRTLGEAVSEAMQRYVDAERAVAGGRRSAGGRGHPADEIAEAEPPGLPVEAAAVGAAPYAGVLGPPLPNAAPTLGACLERLAELRRPDEEYLDELEAIQAAQPGVGSDAWGS